ncbi:MAG: hypothetical protein SV201_05835 [Pseudomonadota bacterium]|nr:hypothetical protein [Pseudomonadota bacterium]
MNTDIQTFIEAVVDHMKHDCTAFGIDGITDTPRGDREDDYMDTAPYDHTYVYQTSGPGEDEYYGNQYFPIGDGKYLSLWYHI